MNMNVTRNNSLSSIKNKVKFICLNHTHKMNKLKHKEGKNKNGPKLACSQSNFYKLDMISLNKVLTISEPNTCN